MGLVERGERCTNILNLLKICQLFNCELEYLIKSIPKIDEIAEDKTNFNRLKLKLQSLDFDNDTNIEFLINMVNLIHERDKKDSYLNFNQNNLYYKVKQD